ncbi:hypothetical protein PAESOLCIP111_04277 [Paenibacillus solanacearum]|uniref:DUF4367 domain-containing protein n=1 Tax=Paenibacillus solanacearum TaxID=2048548 RepID=A0A916K5B4_9BACL|nr:hypothetical protein [Paenibacillus solanacearum]CAG7641858.1 hypothetical protein PAESOLCIP111_04277 [Paenibacillus solanacearum]
MNKNRSRKPHGDVAELLETMEFDNSAAKERIFNRLVRSIETGSIQSTNSKKDGVQMMTRKWKTAAATAAAIVLIGGVFSTTSYAQGMIQSILARFHVGNMEIVQVDKERPVPANANNSASGQESGAESRVALSPQPKRSLQEARVAIGLNFPAPSWMADFKYVNTVLQGKTMVEVQYAQGDKTVNFLISQGGSNGIETTGEVKTAVMNGVTVYFANGIVIWETQGFTVEMYARDDFDAATLEKIVKGFDVGTPLSQAQIDQAKSNRDNLLRTERATQAAPAAASEERK